MVLPTAWCVVTIEVRQGRTWTMFHGKVELVLPTLASGQIDHVITDPPYEKEAHTKMRRSCTGGTNADGSRTFRETPISFDAMTPELRRFCAEQFARVSRRWVLVFCQVEGVPLWRAEGEAAGLRHARSCVWVKPDATPQFTGDRPGSGYECLETLTHALSDTDTEWLQVMHTKERMRWNGGGRRGVFVHNAKTGQRDRAEDHETPKPIPLMLELVSLFTAPGDMVLDAFAGSGSTGVACIRLGRHFVGVEQDHRWYEYCCERFATEERETTVQAARAGQGALFGGP